MRLAFAYVLVVVDLPQHGCDGFNGKVWRKDNDGHPLCNGAESNWPALMCWAPKGGIKRYNCMWYTMEVLSGWPGTPRSPGLTCDDIDIDCASTFVCTVLLEYRGVGPMPHFGEDSDREIAAACLVKQCPLQASLAEMVIDGLVGATCPHTHHQAEVSTTSLHATSTASGTLLQSTSSLAEYTGTRKTITDTTVRFNDTSAPDRHSANTSQIVEAVELGNGGATTKILWPALIIAAATVVAILGVYSLFRPRAVSSARDVLLPAMEAGDDPIMELEAVQETDRMQIATNDAE